MTFVRTDSTGPVSDALAQRIGDRLESGMPVLFLVSGGSTAAIAVDACDALHRRFAVRPGIPQRLLTVSLVDERYGSEGHPDSNWRLLLEKGLHADRTGIKPVLTGMTGDGEDLEAAANRFAAFLAEAVEKSVRGKLYIAGLFGIGSDGHTAGILPGSPAGFFRIPGRSQDTEAPYATGYRSEPFSRITVAAPFFRHIDFAAAYAAGIAKRPALARLEDELPAEVQPAQLLKQARELIVFGDWIPGKKGESA